MSAIYGILGLPDTDRSYVNTLGQRVVYDAVQETLRQHNEELNAAISVFVEGTTEEYKRRYKLPGSGYMQRRGGKAASGAVKATGSWDVAFPLEDFGDQLADDDVTLAYMTLDELDRHLDTITERHINTTRLEMLKAMLNNTQYSFVDEQWGTLAVQPFANGDSVLYPPVLGADAEATENHYAGSNYAASSISDTNNPFKTIRDELEEHFGSRTGGEPIVVFHNNAQNDKVMALTGFVSVNDLWVKQGANTPEAVGLPANLPGRILGRINDCWAVEWRRIPAGYMLCTHLGAKKPLFQRVDPVATGLPQGLQLVSTSDKFPLQSAHYRARKGFGVGNRLNGYVLQLVASTSYSIPSGFSR